MATKGKDSSDSILKKEKKATTPSSNSHTIHKQSNLKSASFINSIDHKEKSTKPVPNYLKPTFSSRSDSLKPVNNNKKNQSNIISNEDATQKLLRRRSFDRPPSAARLQKSLVSPDAKDRLFKATTPVRSSSFSSSSSSASRRPISTTNKPVTERNSKSFKPVKSQQPTTSETVNRSSNFSRVIPSSLAKNTSNLSHSSKVPNVIIPDKTTVAPACNYENKQEETLSVQEETEENVEREAVQAPNTERKEEAGALEDDTQVKDSDEDDEKVNPTETLVAEGKTSSQSSQVEDTESNELQDNENKHQEEEDEEEEKQHIHTSDNHHLDEEGIADNIVKAENNEGKEEEEEINVNEKAASSEETIDEKKKEDMKHGNEGCDEELINSKEGEDHVVMEGKVEGEEEEEEEGKQEVSNEVMQNPQGGQDKKEKETPPTAYNDVIENTKNKLLGLRKNKVKALVGAFETVIDYETAAGSK